MRDFLYPQSKQQTSNFLEQAMSEEWPGFVIAEVETEEYLGQIDFGEILYLN
ncbi:hypothetical protein [Halanaerobaculum tunisiense]